MKRLIAVLLALALAVSLAGCAPGALSEGAGSAVSSSVSGGAALSGVSSGAASAASEAPDVLDADGFYYDLEHVVRYLETYGALPPNYITKAEARALGWEGGPVDRWQEGAAIGGDRFGNREGLLPTAQSRRYTECDLDTLGAGGRGAKRLIFSSDGLYFYTEDHYESFQEVWVTADGEVVWE